ncbi:MAG: hypothetical protein BGP24_09095 [Lysobacterales bacterium 69-70]|nr:MAG: hypothetical protein ABS97_12120 [Xanthomonadaceae bacterium SCN 69-320]ODV20553.1 MAG: hypothetical protein ABT27_07555 [Xanthomonadaceae bacterium SCN 69-25]OJZ00665.1 MAG: hypothetical protein BGP24_09095 [Xanthomonadales bacterium 69-70]
MAPLLQYSGPDADFAGFPDPARFSPEFGESQFRSAARRTNDDPAPRLLSLHLHLPFDAGTVDRGRSQACFHRLARECEMVAPLFDRDRDVVQLQLDGLAGEPAGDVLGELLHAVSRYFFLSHSGTREFLIALPGGVHGTEALSVLVDLGFNRVRFSLPPAAADRDAVALLERSVAAAREAGFRSIGLDLVYGLPLGSDAEFDAGLHRLLGLRVDRINLRCREHPGHAAEAAAPSAERVLRHAVAARALLAAGYETLGLDVFALPQDDLPRARRRGLLHHNWLGFVPQAPTDLIGLGVGARSRIGDACFQSYAELTAWESSIDMGDLPVWRGLQLDADARLRNDLLQALLCTGRVDLDQLQQQHDIVFTDYFRDELAALQPLQAAGLVQLDAHELQLGPQGRLALQAICSPFGAAGRRA